MNLKVTVCALIICAFYQCVQGQYKCYICDSALEENCAALENKKDLKVYDCILDVNPPLEDPDNGQGSPISIPTECLTIVTKLGENGTSLISRTCVAASLYENSCESYWKGYYEYYGFTVQYCSTCNKDHCNDDVANIES